MQSGIFNWQPVVRSWRTGDFRPTAVTGSADVNRQIQSALVTYAVNGRSGALHCRLLGRRLTPGVDKPICNFASVGQPVQFNVNIGGSARSFSTGNSVMDASSVLIIQPSVMQPQAFTMLPWRFANPLWLDTGNRPGNHCPGKPSATICTERPVAKCFPNSDI